MAKRVVFLEGNISSGKSTTIQQLKKLGYDVFEEPLDVWQNNYVHENGKDILTLFYEDMPKWSFPFEVIVMMTRYNRIKDALEHGPKSQENVVFIERSLLTDRHVFAKNLHTTGVISDLEWKIYLGWHDTFFKAVEHMFQGPKVSSVEYFYIRTTPDVCTERKEKRARAAENTMVPKYMVDLHNCHEEWLLNMKEYPVHVINGNASREEVIQQFVSILGNKQLIHRFVELTSSK